QWGLISFGWILQARNRAILVISLSPRACQSNEPHECRVRPETQKTRRVWTLIVAEPHGLGDWADQLVQRLEPRNGDCHFAGLSCDSGCGRRMAWGYRGNRRRSFELFEAGSRPLYGSLKAQKIFGTERLSCHHIGD